MGNAVAQLAAFIDGTGSLRCAVGRHAARERKLLEQFCHAGFILGDIRIDLRIGSVQVVVGDIEVSAVTGAGKQDQVQVIALDGTVHVHEYKVLSRNGSPVTDNLFLNHLTGQRFFQQGIFQKIQLSGRQIVGRAKPLVHASQQFLRNRPFLRTAVDNGITHRQSPSSFSFVSLTRLTRLNNSPIL